MSTATYAAQNTRGEIVRDCARCPERRQIALPGRTGAVLLPDAAKEAGHQPARQIEVCKVRRPQPLFRLVAHLQCPEVAHNVVNAHVREHTPEERKGL
eukprot:scaffold87497_cov63-Phaeocystis_antarctica.AAC.5